MGRKKEVFSEFNKSVLADVLAFSKKAENFRIERLKLRRERAKK